MKDISSIFSTDKKLDFFRPVLDKWIEIVTQYPYEQYDDCPYYYSERMNTGLLATAAMMSKVFYPLEEHPIARKKISGDEEKRRGRADLWLVNAQKEDDKDIIIESKIAWGPGSIVEKTSQASRQLKSMTRSYAGYCMKFSAVFCVKGIPESKFEDQEEDAINKLIKSVNQALADSRKKKSYIAAHCYPQKARSIRGGHVYRHCFYPGVSLVLAEVE